MPRVLADAAAVVALARSDACRFHGRAADRLHVGAGALRLAGPPAWLAETMVMPARILAPGACHVLERDGWYEVQALADSSLRVETPPAPPAVWRRLLRMHGLRLAGRGF